MLLAQLLDPQVGKLLGTKQIQDQIFLKEQYLTAFAALMRRGLLDPEACQLDTKVLASRSSLADDLLRFTLAPQVRENHLRLFGWNLCACANCNVVHAATLLKSMLASPAAANLGQGARRDLSRHMQTPTRDIFRLGDNCIRRDLLQFSYTIDFRLAREIVNAALEARAGIGAHTRGYAK